MPTVPTSPLRALPVAPTVNPELFTQVPSFQEGQQAFEAGAKLPLMMETIKHEKKRIKMENSKLDFAMSSVGQAQEAEVRELALRKARADVAITEATARAQRPLTPEETKSILDAVMGGTAPVATAPVAPQKILPDPAIEYPANGSMDWVENNPFLVGDNFAKSLSDARVAPTNALGQVAMVDGKLTAKEPTPLAGVVSLGEPQAGGSGAPVVRVSSSPKGSMRYTPSFEGNTTDFSLTVPEIASAQGYAPALLPEEIPVAKDAVARKIRGRQVTASQLREIVDATAVPEIAEELVYDNQGLPYKIRVRKVAGQTVGRIGEPRMDREQLYKENPGQETEDTEFKKRMGQMAPAARANVASNLQRMMNAVAYVEAAEASDNPVDSTRLAGLLPGELAKKFLANKTTLARNEVRTVIQQSLRETLGAQFAKVEGEMMMDRAFDPLFGADANLSLIRSAMGSAVEAFSIQQGMEDYYRDNQTLAGFERPLNIASDNPLTNYVTSKIQAGLGASKAKADAVTSPVSSAAPVGEATKKWLSGH